ncbi:hypothetical protein SK128_014112, partial [Halocaridina rubra]
MTRIFSARLYEILLDILAQCSPVIHRLKRSIANTSSFIRRTRRPSGGLHTKRQLRLK